MATMRLLLGLWVLGVLSLLPVTWTQVTSECPMIQTSEIGSTVSPGTDGLIARSYVLQASDDPQPPNVQLFVSNIVCLATGPTRERYRSVSLIANFSCSGAACNNNNVAWQVAQFHFECIQGAWTASLQGSTDFLRTDSPVGTLSTALRRDCSLCIDPMQLPQQLVDQSTHCLPCPAACIGTRTCLSSLPSDCCNFYDTNGGCVTGCPSGEVPNSPFQCSVASGIVVGFEFASYSFSEEDGLGRVTITSSAALPDGTVIHVNGGSAMQPSTVRVSGPILINQTLTTLPASINFTISDDNIALETVETFPITFNSSDSSVVIGGPGRYASAQISIADDDVIVVEFQQEAYIVSESNGTVQVCLHATTITARLITFTVLTQDGTAQSGVDYQGGTFPSSIAANTNQGCVQIPVIRTAEIESNETFSVNFTLTTTHTELRTGRIQTATITIIDTPVLFTFRQPMYVIMENVGNMEMVCVDKLDNTTETFTVLVTASGGGRNWTESLVFQPEDTEMCLSPRIQDDNVALEGVESFTLSLGFPAGQLRAGLGQYSTTNVMVMDDDELVLTTDRPPVVPENIGTTQVCVQFSAPFAQPFRIPVASTMIPGSNMTTITNMFPAIPGVDYGRINITLDVTPQDSDAGEVCFNVTIEDDSEVEQGLECLMVAIRLPDALSMVRIADGNESVMICIMDDDQSVLFTFRQPMYVIMENVGNMEMVCVDKLDNTTETFTVLVTASGGGRNWTESLVFRPKDTEMCLSPQIQDDNVALEGVESFTLSLGFPAGQLRSDLGQYNTTDVMVMDDDELVLTTDSPPVVPENIGTAQVCIQFSAPFAQPFRIPVASTMIPGSNMTTITYMFPAIPGVDYGRINITLDVTPQDSDAGEVCFNVTIEDDSEVEQGLECLMVAIQLPDALSMVRIADGNESVMICIMDDDQMPQPVNITQLQCVVRSTINTTSDITTFDNNTIYSFNRTCEHVLATSCDTLASDFSILIDQLDGQLFTSKVGVYYRNIAAVFDSGDLEVISGDPSQYEVESLLGAETLILRELGNLSVSYVREALGVSVRVTIDENILPNVCGLCGNVIGQPVLRNSSVVDISGEAQLQLFVDEYFVKPGETRLRQIERQQCGLIRNDTVIGDPLYTVPVFGTQERHLCYEIHGRPMRYFNLISDSCVSVNAHYVERIRQITVNGVTESEILNIINQIGVRAVDNMGNCINIAVNVVGCAASVNGVSRSSYQQAGVRMRRFSNHVRIVVPNCADTNLVMRVFCQNISGIEMIKFVVSRGLNIREVAHGLIGQFWNIPISVERYTGVTRDGSTNVYIVTVTPPNGKQRAFPAWREDQTWDGTDIPCLYAGSRQGGPVYEVEDPNDPLIEGRYFNYIVDGPFATQYQYSHFEENRCR